MRTDNVIYEPSIHQLDLLVTERCNFDCVYCFHKQRPMDMTDEILQKAIDMMADQIHPRVIFNFFGGEPILMEDFCLKWMHRLRERFPECRFHFTTNGSVYSERLVNDWLIKEDPIIQISHDGINQARLRGHEELVTGNLKKYIKAVGVDKVTTRLTFTNETVGDLMESVEYFYGIGVRRFAHQADITNEWTEENIQEYCRQLDEIYDFMEEHPDLDVVFANCKKLTVSRVRNRQCSMGRELVSLTANGEIFPCHRAVKFPDFKIGDVFTGELNRGKFPVLNMDGCDKCDASDFCHQCFLANYEQNGSLEEPVESGCSINRYEFKKLSEKNNYVKADFEGSMELCAKAVEVLTDINSNNTEILRVINE